MEKERDEITRNRFLRMMVRSGGKDIDESYVKRLMFQHARKVKAERILKGMVSDGLLEEKQILGQRQTKRQYSVTKTGKAFYDELVEDGLIAG